MSNLSKPLANMVMSRDPGLTLKGLRGGHFDPSGFF